MTVMHRKNERPQGLPQMEINQIMKELKSLRTWVRVIELQRRGYFKNKEKRVLFGDPIPPEDILPLRIATILTISIVILVLIIAASWHLRLFSIIGNILLLMLLVIIMLLPDIIIAKLKKAGKK